MEQQCNSAPYTLAVVAAPWNNKSWRILLFAHNSNRSSNECCIRHAAWRRLEGLENPDYVWQTMIPALDYKSDRFATLLLLPTATSKLPRSKRLRTSRAGRNKLPWRRLLFLVLLFQLLSLLLLLIWYHCCWYSPTSIRCSVGRWQSRMRRHHT